jgi:hypothetical protein
MIAGSLSLGGKQTPIQLPVTTQATNQISGRLAHTRGHWLLASDRPYETISIPSRDKQVELFGDLTVLRAHIETLDSTEGPNYLSKLTELMESHTTDGFLGALVNVNTSTHSSMAFVARRPIHFYGLYDTQLDHAYIVWSTDPTVLQQVVQPNPLRFLVYRFPVLHNSCMFLAFEAVCAKWWRWTRNGVDLLAFNALERRLFGPLST